MRAIAFWLVLSIGACYADIKALNIPQDEQRVIEAAMERNSFPLELKPLLYSIRKAENGSWGRCRAFGVINPKAQASVDAQAGWACATIAKRYTEWKASNSDIPFVSYLAASWCPVGADNDPKGLNANWISNVQYWYAIAIQ